MISDSELKIICICKLSKEGMFTAIHLRKPLSLSSKTINVRSQDGGVTCKQISLTLLQDLCVCLQESLSQKNHVN